MLQFDPIQSYLNLKIGQPPVLKAGSFGILENQPDFKFSYFNLKIDLPPVLKWGLRILIRRKSKSSIRLCTNSDYNS